MVRRPGASQDIRRWCVGLLNFLFTKDTATVQRVVADIERGSHPLLSIYLDAFVTEQAAQQAPAAQAVPAAPAPNIDDLACASTPPPPGTGTVSGAGTGAVSGTATASGTARTRVHRVAVRRCHTTGLRTAAVGPLGTRRRHRRRTTSCAHGSPTSHGATLHPDIVSLSGCHST